MRSPQVAHWLGIAPFQLNEVREAREDCTRGWIEQAIRQRPGDITRGGGVQPNRFAYALDQQVGIVQWSRPVHHSTLHGSVTVRAPYGTFFRRFTDMDGQPWYWPRTSLIPNPCLRPSDRGAHA